MIDLDSVTIEGFLSWGTYPTVLKLSGMEQCFILGQVADQPDGASNGAGKTSLMQAIVWALSGKTVYNSNPGDKVLNWFSDGAASVRLDFKNGDYVHRVRTRDGTTELAYCKNSRDIIDCTLSTTSNQQRLLENELNYDHDVFCGSVFFSQYRQPWLAMQDQSRKQAFERIMGIDRLTIYAEVAKRKIDKAQTEQDKLRNKATNIQSVIESLTNQLTATQQACDAFETNRQTRHAAKIQEAAELTTSLQNIESIDIEKLQQRWTIVEKIKKLIGQLEDQITAADAERTKCLNNKPVALQKASNQAAQERNAINAAQYEKKNEYHKNLIDAERARNAKIATINIKKLDIQTKASENQGAIQSLDKTITKWREKAGKICTECEQELPPAYTASKIDTIEANKLTLQKLAKEFENNIKQYGLEIKHAEDDYLQVKSEIDKLVVAVDTDAAVALSDIEIRLEAAVEVIEKASEAQLEKLNTQKLQIQNKVQAAKSKLADNTPELTIPEALAKNTRRDTVLSTIGRLNQEAAGILTESNVQTTLIDNLEANITNKGSELTEAQKQIGIYDVVIKHLTYIHRAYSDRKRIKSYLISRHRPYFNSRLHHYLDLFNLDIRISLTDSLGVESNLWGYDFQSGGERGRTDLSFMFAVFDLHQGVHGPQCNILVLDEPEKALDEAGRQVLINIIKNDLATRFESIFVISHSDCFRDVFPHQITIERTDRFSHITDIR